MIAMSSSTAADSYKILVTGTSEPASSESITEVYDSRTGFWNNSVVQIKNSYSFGM
ncbi:hypothetical protein FRX31_025736, partial [Thalictrum thalictroides]